MNKVLLTAILITILLGGGLLFFFINKKPSGTIITPVTNNDKKTEMIFEKYAFGNLKKKEFTGDKIILGDVLKDEIDFVSYLFSFTTEEKKVSGLANIPKAKNNYPVIVMLRGYIDQETYTTGMGTKNSAEAFAKAGFITLAPDFLGYGDSASPSANPIEERFEKYTTVLSLLASIKNLPQAIKNAGIENVEVETEKIGLWGHSNGGHLALTVLELTNKLYPTVLWAPVSKPFPYSILYYTDESDDHGKALRKVLADFEKDYDAEKYSTNNYYDWINKETPIQLHQGGNDEAVPQEWSDELYKNLKELDLAIEYSTYSKEDHNFAQGSWQTVIDKNIDFYKNNFLLISE